MHKGSFRLPFFSSEFSFFLSFWLRNNFDFKRICFCCWAAGSGFVPRLLSQPSIDLPFRFTSAVCYPFAIWPFGTRYSCLARIAFVWPSLFYFPGKTLAGWLPRNRLQLIDSFAPSSLCFLSLARAKLKSFAQLFFLFSFTFFFLYFCFVWFNCRLLLLLSDSLAFPPLELPLRSFLLFAISV